MDVTLKIETYKRKLIYRIILPVFLGAIFTIVILALVDSPEYFYMDIKLVLMMLFSILVIISYFRFMVTISEDFLIIRDIRSRKIFYYEINKIKFIDGKLIVYSNSTNISITTDLEKQQEVIDYVINKIKHNPTIEIFGDIDVAESYGFEIKKY